MLHKIIFPYKLDWSFNESNIYAVQQDTQSVSMSEFIQHFCQLDMFRTSSVHQQERFLQPVFADLLCGPMRSETCRANISDE